MDRFYELENFGMHQLIVLYLQNIVEIHWVLNYVQPMGIVFHISQVEDMEQYNQDLDQCTQLAITIDLDSEAAIKSLAGAAAGGVAVAGIATAVAGAVFLPALPFIAAGAALGGGALGAGVSAKEKKQRNQIFGNCMRDRGYRAYIPD